MCLNLLKTRLQINERLTTIRSIDRLINCDRFNTLYDYSNNNQKLEVIEAIRKNDKNAILEWMKTISRDIDYNEINLKELQVIAKQHNINNFTRLPKIVLLKEINELRNRNDERKIS